MKFILCSVCLAHGAVVYTVCAPFSAGLYQEVSHKNCTFNVVLDKSTTKHLESKKSQKKKGSANSTFSSLGNQSSSGKIQQDGWQMVGDFSIHPLHDITIHFTVDAHSQISNIQITPFTSSLHTLVCDQLKHIKFIWKSTSPPPAHTTFEKRICIR